MFCPICGERTDSSECPKCHIPTIKFDRYEKEKDADPMIGRVLIKKYKLIQRLGAGGMGTVYKGVNLDLKEVVAIKVMHPELAKNQQIYERFKREALSTSKLTHPNTVRIYDFGIEEDGTQFIVMEYVKGTPLSHIIRKEKRLPPARVIKIIQQVLGSLAEAHSRGIVHRDIKPSNIMILQMPGSPDFVKVLDFGIAKLLWEENSRELTKTGTVIGSPDYMAPEQADGLPVDPRTDLYALGIVMYEMLVGNPPFSATTPIAILIKHKTEPLPPFPDDLAKEIPVQLQDFIKDLTQKDPNKRIGSAKEALERLEKIWSYVSTLTITNQNLDVAGLEVQDKNSKIISQRKSGHYDGEGRVTRKSSAVLWFIIGGVVLLLGVGGIAGYYFMQQGMVIQIGSVQNNSDKEKNIITKGKKKTTNTKINAQTTKSDTPVKDKNTAKNNGTTVRSMVNTPQESKKRTEPDKIKTKTHKKAVKYIKVPIITIPAGAKVYLNGKLIGVSPVKYTFKYPPRGVIKIEKKGFKSIKITLSRKTKWVKVFLKPQ